MADKDFDTATNPKTGEKRVYLSGQWQPLQGTATNPKTGEKAYQVGGQWRVPSQERYGPAKEVWGIAKDLATGFAKRFQVTPSDRIRLDPKTGKIIPEQQQPEPKDKSAATRVGEVIGDLSSGGPGELGKIGGAAASLTSRAGGGSISRALGSVAERIPGVRNTFLAARDPTVVKGAAQTAQLAKASGLAEQGSLAAARARDVNLSAMGQGTLGQRTGSGALQAVERVSGVLPGGGALRRATTVADVYKAGGRAQEISQDLATAAGKYTGSSAERQFASDILSKMGYDKKGVFDADRFLKDWQAMGPQRQSVFGAKAIGSSYAKDMDKLAESIEKIQEYATRRPLKALGQKLKGGGPVGAAIGAATGVAGVMEAKAIIGALLNLKGAALTAGGLSANYVFAKAMTNPSTVKWLAVQAAKVAASYAGENYELQVRQSGPSLSDIQGDLR